MKTLNSFCLVLSFAFALTLIKPSCALSFKSKWQLPSSQWNVTILNHVKNSELLVHCRSKDDDLGKHILKPNGQVDWEFKMNFWQSTRYWCYFSSKHGHASFEVFWPEKGTWLSERCDYRNCIWLALDDGFYLVNLRGNGLEFVHKWEPGS